MEDSHDSDDDSGNNADISRPSTSNPADGSQQTAPTPAASVASRFGVPSPRSQPVQLDDESGSSSLSELDDDNAPTVSQPKVPRMRRSNRQSSKVTPSRQFAGRQGKFQSLFTMLTLNTSMCRTWF
jgi:hypothetical protein